MPGCDDSRDSIEQAYTFKHALQICEFAFRICESTVQDGLAFDQRFREHKRVRAKAFGIVNVRALKNVGLFSKHVGLFQKVWVTFPKLWATCPTLWACAQQTWVKCTETICFISIFEVKSWTTFL